jgi:subtilisin family serine protease
VAPPPPAPTAPVYSAPVLAPAGYVITPSGQQPVRSVNDTPEFRHNYSANEFVNGLHALDSGRSGRGVVVAAVDDGVVNVNGELDGRIDLALSKDLGSVTARRDVLGDEHADHGPRSRTSSPPVAMVRGRWASPPTPGSRCCGSPTGTRTLGFRLIQSQNATAVARATADRQLAASLS